jgi:sialidase-1
MKQNVRCGLRWSLLVIAFLCLAAALAPMRRIASSVRHAFADPPVFVNGTEGYHCFRIPAIVQLPDGMLLAFAEARKYDCNDFGDIRIVMRSSHDEGKSWSALQTVASNGSPVANNPVPVVDTMDPRYPHGRILLLYSTAALSEDKLAAGQGSAHVWYRASTDDGATWTPPVEITSSVNRPSWGNYGTGPGHGLQLTDGPHKGRIFIPAFHSEVRPRPDERDTRAHSFFSDDHGQTWTLGPTVAWPGASESTAAQASDGSVVMNSRDETGASHARIMSISRSAGERWDKTFAARDLPDPACEGSMVSYTPPGHQAVLLFSNLLNTNSNRQGLAVSESTDDGRTWPRHTVIYKHAAAYSDLVVMRGGTLGILWERGDDGLVFETRPIRDLF